MKGGNTEQADNGNPGVTCLIIDEHYEDDKIYQESGESEEEEMGERNSRGRKTSSM